MALQFPYRTDHQKDVFDKKVQVFMAKASEKLPALSELNFCSQPTTIVASQIATPRADPIFLESTILGHGGYGLVRKLINVSTGSVYAGKTFTKEKGWPAEYDIMRELKHVGLRATSTATRLTDNRNTSFKSSAFTIKPSICSSWSWHLSET